jgi:hypothetical protein
VLPSPVPPLQPGTLGTAVSDLPPGTLQPQASPLTGFLGKRVKRGGAEGVVLSCTDGVQVTSDEFKCRFTPGPSRRGALLWKKGTHDMDGRRLAFNGCTGLDVLGQQPKSGAAVDVACEQSHDRDTTLACIYTFGLIRYGGVGYPCLSGLVGSN